MRTGFKSAVFGTAVAVAAAMTTVACGGAGATAANGSAGEAVTGGISLADAVRLLPMPIRHQPENFSCGPTSLSSVLAFWQVQYVNQETLHAPLGTTKANGTEPWGMRDYAANLGLDATIRGTVSDALDADTAAKVAVAGDVTLDDLRSAACSGRFHTADCVPTAVIIDFQAWGGGDQKGPQGYASDYTNEWEDGHYVVLAGIDDSDSGNVYLMDPDDTDKPGQKAYSYVPIQGPRGLLTRWHDYFGTNPNADAGGAPPEAQQWNHGAIFFAAGTAGVARETFESLNNSLQLSRRKPDATAAEVRQLRKNVLETE